MSRVRAISPPLVFYFLRRIQIDSTAGGFSAASISAVARNLFVLDYDSKLNPYFMFEVDTSPYRLGDGRFVPSRINHDTIIPAAGRTGSRDTGFFFLIRWQFLETHQYRKLYNKILYMENETISWRTRTSFFVPLLSCIME